MLVVMMNDATEAQVARVVEIIREMGYEGRPMPGAQRTTVGLVGSLMTVSASLAIAASGFVVTCRALTTRADAPKGARS